MRGIKLRLIKLILGNLGYGFPLRKSFLVHADAAVVSTRHVLSFALFTFFDDIIEAFVERLVTLYTVVCNFRSAVPASAAAVLVHMRVISARGFGFDLIVVGQVFTEVPDHSLAVLLPLFWGVVLDESQLLSLLPVLLIEVTVSQLNDILGDSFF